MEQTNKIEFKVYTIEKYNEIFKQIKYLPDNLEPEVICKFINQNLSLSIIIVNQIIYEQIKDFNLYRLRIPSRMNKYLIDNESFYTYPPLPNKMGRANLANQQVFYASADANTAIFELKKYIKPNSKVVLLSVWGFKPFNSPVFSRNLFYGIPENVENNLASIVSTGLHDRLNTMFSSMENKLRKKFLYAQKRLSGIFAWKGNKYYHITSAIANDTFYEAQKQNVDIPILIYPSVAKNKTSVNFAIRKDFVDNYISLLHVLKIKINTINTNMINIEVLAKGIPDNGKINWIQPRIKETIGRPFISSDGDPKTMEQIPLDIKLTHCCIDHAFPVESMAEKLSLHDRLSVTLAKVPLDIYSKFPHIYNVLVPVKLLKPLFFTNNISEEGQIKYLMYPILVEYIMDY